MLYLVKDKGSLLSNARNALRNGGKLMIDDWMLTPLATPEDSQALGRRVFTPHLAVREDLMTQIVRNGFRLQRFVDLGHVARNLLSKHFPKQYNCHFRRTIERELGKKIERAFFEGIVEAIRLYKEEKLTYCRLLAIKEENA